VRWIVDASNVIGSRPDGWWRDREAATRRLIDSLKAFAADTGEPMTVVLDAGPAELAGRTGGIEVVLAARHGRDAADDEIVALLEAAAPDAGARRVVTSDSTLAARARALGAEIEGAGRFRDRLDRY
jgi:predicted RNA-binding protein with PIN domain